MKCPICSENTTHFESALIMEKYDGHFRRCFCCNFIFAENPLWLNEAYSNAISASDVGLVYRNLWFSRVTRSMIRLLCNRSGKFLDYGGGTGLFTKLMRDAGYDWYNYDRFCRNSFADGFCVDVENMVSYELITASELFEHIANPSEIISLLEGLSPNILITTQLLPDSPPPLSSWWYYGLEHGQHISFYGIQSLKILAKKSGMYLSSNGNNVHLFSRKKIPAFVMKIISNDLFGRLVYPKSKL